MKQADIIQITEEQAKEMLCIACKNGKDNWCSEFDCYGSIKEWEQAGIIKKTKLEKWDEIKKKRYFKGVTTLPLTKQQLNDYADFLENKIKFADQIIEELREDKE